MSDDLVPGRLESTGNMKGRESEGRRRNRQKVRKLSEVRRELATIIERRSRLLWPFRNSAGRPAKAMKPLTLLLDGL